MFLLTGVGFLVLVIFVFDLGHGAACYCLGSSLSRKESGRVFVVPLQLDSFVPVRDIGIQQYRTPNKKQANKKARLRFP